MEYSARARERQRTVQPGGQTPAVPFLSFGFRGSMNSRTKWWLAASVENHQAAHIHAIHMDACLPRPGRYSSTVINYSPTRIVIHFCDCSLLLLQLLHHIPYITLSCFLPHFSIYSLSGQHSLYPIRLGSEFLCSLVSPPHLWYRAANRNIRRTSRLIPSTIRALSIFILRVYCVVK